MCGRFTLSASPEAIALTFDLAAPPEVSPRYNIAPSQPILAVTAADPASDSLERCDRYYRWGLVPHWAKDSKIGYRLINARAETVAEKPAFRQAFQRQRCLIVADGFYEWRVADQARKAPKQPFYFQQQDGAPFGFAGLWARWQPPEGEPLFSCTILTTAANAAVAPVHHRMPIIVEPSAYDVWLDPSQPLPVLQGLLTQERHPALSVHPVSTQVNSPRQDGPQLVQPLPDR